MAVIEVLDLLVWNLTKKMSYSKVSILITFKKIASKLMSRIL